MLIDSSKMCDLLGRIASRLTTDVTLQEDLLQEALIRPWKLEGEKPGQTASWYLQNCRFHLQHYLASGRSVDSPKRANGNNRIAIDTHDHDMALEGYDTNGETMELIHSHDIVQTLSKYLKPRENVVLGGLAHGLVLREIAKQLHVSYAAALRYRRKIASVAIKLGITPCLRTVRLNPPVNAARKSEDCLPKTSLLDQRTKPLK